MAEITYFPYLSAFIIDEAVSSVASAYITAIVETIERALYALPKQLDLGNSTAFFTFFSKRITLEGQIAFTNIVLSCLIGITGRT